MSEADREKWNARFARGDWPSAPAPFLLELDALLPRAGRALDVAGGPGVNACWLARRGLEVTLVDVSEVALAQAREAAGALAVRTVALDLEAAPLPAGPFALVVCLHYLDRALLPRLGEGLAPGGLLVFAAATRRNLERHERPSGRYLLDEGELAGRVPPGLAVVSLWEGWTADGHHEARLVARRG